MGVDVVERMPEKLRVDRGPSPWIRHRAERGWQNEFTHELSGLGVPPPEDPGGKIRTDQDNVVVIQGNANISGGRNQSRGRRKCVLGDLHGSFVVPSLRGQGTQELLQHIVLQGHGSACVGNRVKGSAVPLVYFLQTSQFRLGSEDLSCNGLHSFWRIGALDLRKYLADT